MVAVLALVAGAVVGTVFRRASPGFEVDEPGSAFRTPRSATPVFVVLFLLAVVALFVEIGGWSWTHGDRDAGWIVVLVLLCLPAVALAAVSWRGQGIALTPEGIHAGRGTGTLVIPWNAVSAVPPRPASPSTDNCLDVVLADPDQVTTSGLLRRSDRIFFEGTPPAFVAAAIQQYAAHPADRPLIGTPDEHHRLVELLAIPAAPVEPPPSRRRIAVFAALGVMTFGVGIGVSVAGDAWIDTTIGLNQVLSYAAYLLGNVLALIGINFFAAAGRGVHARRRPAPPSDALRPPQPTSPPRPEQPSPTTPPATRPAWARDVTNEYR